MITKELIEEIRKKYVLSWNGIHGVAHWSRVRWNGLKMAEKNGADRKVVELFAFLHDSCRELDSSSDVDHGKRAAEFAEVLNAKNIIKISEYQLGTLQIACEYHSVEGYSSNLTVHTCWDADRLDLGRVGIIPDPNRLCTDEARELLPEAYARSMGFYKK